MTLWDCRLSTKAWSVSTHYVLLRHISCRTWSHIEFQRLAKYTIAPYLYEHVRRQQCYQSCLYKNWTVQAHHVWERVWESASTLPLRHQAHLKQSVQSHLLFWNKYPKVSELDTKQNRTSDFLFAKANEIVKVTLKETKVSKPRLTRKVVKSCSGQVEQEFWL